jgi:phosphotransferase system HPr (HPr) family protein
MTNMPRAEASLIITNKVGLHARPAALLVQTAGQFQSRIQVQLGERVVNAKSILNVMRLNAPMGTTIVVRAEGDDAEQAIAALTELTRRNFDEEE